MPLALRYIFLYLSTKDIRGEPREYTFLTQVMKGASKSSHAKVQCIFFVPLLSEDHCQRLQIQFRFIKYFKGYSQSAWYVNVTVQMFHSTQNIPYVLHQELKNLYHEFKRFIGTCGRAYCTDVVVFGEHCQRS